MVEAKKITLGPQNVLTQAQRYSRGVASSALNFDGNRVRFDRDYNIRCLSQTSERCQSPHLMLSPHTSRGGDMAAYAAALSAQLLHNLAGGMALLRDPVSKIPWSTYGGAPQTFIVAYEAKDAVLVPLSVSLL